MKDNFARYRSLGWWVFSPQCFQYFIVLSCLHIFWGVIFNYYIFSSIGKVFLFLCLLSKLLFYFLIFWSLNMICLGFEGIFCCCSLSSPVLWFGICLYWEEISVITDWNITSTPSSFFFWFYIMYILYLWSFPTVLWYSFLL